MLIETETQRMSTAAIDPKIYNIPCTYHNRVKCSPEVQTLCSVLTRFASHVRKLERL